uniref:Uncharacterized protein n=1 Tax=Arion vulgaris TaxID=1028688 RepID=A0A0B7BBQ6_9EUPU
MRANSFPHMWNVECGIERTKHLESESMGKWAPRNLDIQNNNRASVMETNQQELQQQLTE